MFISVKEAMELTGMSSTTIYRLCNKRINTLYIRKEDNKFLIDKDFIMAAYPPDIVNVTEQLDDDGNSAIHEPEFEVVETNNPETTIQFVIDNEPADVDEISVDDNISDSEEDIKLITLSQKSQIEKNVISQKTDLQTNIAVDKKMPDKETNVLKLFNLETYIGIAASIIVAGILIYLFYLDVK